MTRFASLLTALALLVFNGAAASRVCACMDAMSKPSCCAKDMPCCDGDDCRVHTDPMVKAELAVELFKSLDGIYALASMPTAVSVRLVPEPESTHAPTVVRVRGPDIRDHSLRAPPYQA